MEKAKKDFKQCLKIEPNDEKSHKYLSFIYNKEKSNTKKINPNDIMSFDFGRNENFLQRKRSNK